MKSADRATIRLAEAASGVDGYTLMKRAGASVARELETLSRGFSRIVFLAGNGNNAGDAFVAAAQVDFPRVKVLMAQEPDSYRGEAASAWREFGKFLDAEVRDTLRAGDLLPGDLVVDAILGIGFHGEAVRAPLDQWISFVNASSLVVLSLDLPSGIDADTGVAAKTGAVSATRTLTFGIPKTGLFRNDGERLSGIVHFADLGFPQLGGGMQLYTMREAARDLPRRAFDDHKKSCGSVLVSCGSCRYPGAGRLAATAALRGGAGYVTLATQTKVNGLCAALLVRQFTGAAELKELFPGHDALVAGCGWGEQGVEMLQCALDFPGALLLDADALNLLARHPDAWKKRENVVLTPHPGEAKRLATAFGITETLPRDELALELARKLHAVVLLKGSGTLVATPQGEISRNTSGSPSLATAGSGDVLAGLIGALLARKISPFTAAKLGAFLHGLCGEMVSAGLIADDLPPLFGEAFEAVRRHGIVWRM
ncbi:MAG: NAD(P)H-hydrate dehydratase [Victivallaceae bacterium]|nr:NAD(P)H-hydrate dehydratase [Victivallaceae bacterium]